MTSGERPGALCFERTTVLPCARLADVWEAVVTWESVNAELAPIAMSHPEAFPRIDRIPADGRVHFASVLTCFRIPFDRHRLALVELEPHSHFQEVSSNLLSRRWTHRRSLEVVENGVALTDRCTLTPRWAPLGPLLLSIHGRIFDRRHARLRRRFEGPGPETNEPIAPEGGTGSR